MIRLVVSAMPLADTSPWWRELRCDWRSAFLPRSDWWKMSGLQARTEEPINGVDVREQGSALRSVFTFVWIIKRNQLYFFAVKYLFSWGSRQVVYINLARFLRLNFWFLLRQNDSKHSTKHQFFPSTSLKAYIMKLNPHGLVELLLHKIWYYSFEKRGSSE